MNQSKAAKKMKAPTASASAQGGCSHGLNSTQVLLPYLHTQPPQTNFILQRHEANRAQGQDPAYLSSARQPLIKRAT